MMRMISGLTGFSICLLAWLGAPMAAAKEKPNILFICVDDLRPELPSFGKSYIKTPNINRLISKSRLFKRHYVQAPTCGASRFSMLTGLYPTKAKELNNTAAMQHNHEKEPSFPAWLRGQGYFTVSMGKVSHYPGGLAGKNWNDPTKPEMPNAWDSIISTVGEWKTPVGQMHGTANGAPRVIGKTKVFEALDARYPDDVIVEAFAATVPTLKKQQKPWLCAVGLIRPHLPFACPKRYYDLYAGKEVPVIPANKKPAKGEFWHGSGEFMQYVSVADPRKDQKYANEVIRHYAACVSYADDSIGKILSELEKSGMSENTIVVLWGDHGWHLGEQKIWGKHSPYAVALHSPLIVKVPGQQSAGVASDEVVESIDIYPTLCELVGLKTPSHVEGKSLAAIVLDPKAKTDGVALSYWAGLESKITADTHEMTLRKSGKVVQKYNLKTDPHETTNLIRPAK